MSDVRGEGVGDRVEVYAAWVRRLRTEGLPPGPVREPNDPLERLGEELELLSAEVSRRGRGAAPAARPRANRRARLTVS